MVVYVWAGRSSGVEQELARCAGRHTGEAWKGWSMSGSHTTAKLIPAREALGADGAVSDLRERLAWPAAALLIVLVSGGLWYGAARALSALFS